MARKYQDLIREEVKLDTRKLYSTEAFETGLDPGIRPAESSSTSGVNIS